MWLYVPAVKQGTTKKLSSFWRGPYTVTDRLNARLNYRMLGYNECNILPIIFNQCFNICSVIMPAGPKSLGKWGCHGKSGPT